MLFLDAFGSAGGDGGAGETLAPVDSFASQVVCVSEDPNGVRYRVLGRLGAGGMGQVVRAMDPMLGREVAIKRLHPYLVARRGQKERFIAEAQTIAQLQHPGIVPVFERGLTPDGVPFYTMPVVQGRTLGQAIAAFHAALLPHRWPEKEGLSLHRMVSVLRKAAEAVGYAHSQGVVHRDLKPDNIMLGSFGEVWVMDWGLAKVEGASESRVSTIRTGDSLETREGVVTGTPAYMSPEQARGCSAGSRSDVYALGTILYELLSGTLPYNLSNPEDSLDALRRGAPIPLVGCLGPAHPSVPPGLIAICERAMQRDPAERFTDGVALAEALAGWLEGAQRREQARAVVVQAQTLTEEAREATHRAETLRGEASRWVEKGAAAMWALLERSREAASTARELERESLRQLHSALVFDPSLPEAHRALVEGYRSLRNRAHIQRDDQRASEAEALLQAHLSALSPRDPLRWAMTEEAARLGRSVLPPRQGVCLAGREGLLAELGAWRLSSGRLLTLVGTAGSGKTRLATHFARRENMRVAFCALATARTAEDIVRRVAAALEISLRAGEARVQVGNALRGRGPMLLVLDNLEQAKDAAVTLACWLEVAPALRIVATSRSRLGLPEEQVLEVAPLELLAAAEMFESVARQSRPSFRISARSLPQVLDLVEQLDRLPLAIELAAARMGALGLAGIRDRLSDRFALLRGRLRDPSARALQGALEASWELLTESEQGALAACSVFHGGWDLAAAESVLSVPSGVPPVLDLLEALVDDHLVVRTEGEVTRFGLLESVRVFAAEKLGARQERVDERHAQHYATYGSEAWIQSLNTHGGAERYRALLLERENLLVGMRSPRAVLAAACALALGRAYNQVGPAVEGAERLGRVLERCDLDAAVRGRLLTDRVRLQRLGGQADARSYEDMDRALAIARETGDRRLEGIVLECVGMLHRQQGQMSEALRFLEAALLVHREVGNRREEGVVLGALGMVHQEQGRMDEASLHLAAALKIHREFGDRRATGAVLGNLAVLHQGQGRMDEARAHFAAALAIHREVGNRFLEAILLSNLGILHREEGQMDQARAHYDAALAVNREVGNRLSEGIVLSNLGILHHCAGRLDEAQAHFEEALGVHREVGNRRSEGIVLANLGELHHHRGHPGEAQAYYESALVVHGEVGNLGMEAIALIGLGSLRKGHLEEARQHYERALSLAREIGNPRLEGSAIGHLGMLMLESDGSEARRCLSEAISLEAGIDRDVGTFRGSLALLRAEEGCLDDARALLERGEEQLRGRHQLPFALLLCKRGLIERTWGDPARAKAALRKASTIAEELGVGPQSELMVALQGLRSLLA